MRLVPLGLRTNGRMQKSSVDLRVTVLIGGATMQGLYF
jgi:hypothetical protein